MLSDRLRSFAPAILPSLGPLRSVDVEALYVHVPFCVHKCHYCDFYSITRQSPQRMERFVDLLLREADGWAEGTRGPWVRPRTVFFGGGTPTLLPPDTLGRLIAGVRERFDLSGVSEWTVEANPATLTAEHTAALRGGGVNRISFGAQSFSREELAALERHHDPDDVPRGIEIARAAGFRRLNLDLIYAIPGQDLASWARSLEAAMALGTDHLSCYGLTYEPNTPMAVKLRLGRFAAAEESLELSMMRHARRTLRSAGFAPYEISNFATPGAECAHNLVYWTGGNYLGLGPSAASHVEGVRWKNRPHLGEWERGVESGDPPIAEAERLTPAQRAGELAMLMLRLEGGIDAGIYRAKTGIDPLALLADPIARFRSVGLLTDETDERLALSERGIELADAIAAEFLSAAAAGAVPLDARPDAPAMARSAFPVLPS